MLISKKSKQQNCMCDYFYKKFHVDKTTKVAKYNKSMAQKVVDCIWILYQFTSIFSVDIVRRTSQSCQYKFTIHCNTYRSIVTKQIGKPDFRGDEKLYSIKSS